MVPSANTTAKLASGNGDNQALSVLCEGLGTPRVNAANARHPAWAGHLRTSYWSSGNWWSPGATADGSYRGTRFSPPLTG